MDKIVYAIDASSLIEAAKNYNLKLSVFKPIWDKLAEMFEEGTLISSIEIFEELKDDDLVEWIKPYKKCFINLTQSIQQNVTEVLRENSRLINLKTNKKSISNGDPFLIATAIEHHAIVVTNESMKSEIKIPAICKKFDLESMNLNQFIAEIMK